MIVGDTLPAFRSVHDLPALLHAEGIEPQTIALADDEDADEVVRFEAPTSPGGFQWQPGEDLWTNWPAYVANTNGLDLAKPDERANALEIAIRENVQLAKRAGYDPNNPAPTCATMGDPLPGP